jgi:hypothetical protein
MKRSSLLLVAAAILLSLGFTTAGDTAVSKIYVYGDLLIRSNTTAGRIDIFDLSKPDILPKVASIRLESNSDVAVVDGIMYADAGRDLVLFDISDIANVHAFDTLHSVFYQMYRAMPVDQGMPIEEGSGMGMSGCNACNESTPVAAAESDAGGSTRGTAGSLARFAVAGDYLYAIDYSDVVVFDIAMPRRPQLKNRVSVAWDMETLFPSGTTLFAGGSRGVYLVDIADGETPKPISQFEHGRGCDPVVVEGNRAYVTLRSGTPCGEVSDQLDIIDVSNLRNPTLITTVPATNPYGLAVRDGIVYLCDGTGGVKIIDATDPYAPRTTGAISGIVAHDAIVIGQKLIVSTSERAIVYDQSTPTPVAHGSVSLLE